MAPPPISVVLLCALFGLVVGSFANVAIHRIPRGSSTVKPRSRCPYCGAGIRARDNIPVLSYLLLRGKCRACAAPISFWYPLIELLTAGLFAGCGLAFGWSMRTLVAALFCTLLVILAGIDAEHFLLPDKITLPGIAVGLITQPLVPEIGFFDAFLGAVLGAGALILLINIWYLIRNEEGMGLGDVNMLAMIGAFLGWQGAFMTLLMATFLGLLVGVAFMALQRLQWKSKLPFGVFLAAGAVVALFWGPRLAALYLNLL